MSSAVSHLLTRIDVWRALASWPKFSLSSYRLVSSLRRQGVVPGTVIDVGANVGQFAVACAKMFPDATIHSFEPIPECVEGLRRHAAKLDRIRVYPMALGARTGDISIHVNSHRHSSSLLSLGRRHQDAFPAAREIGTIQVPISTLDEQFSALPLEGPVLLKLDVQGYEPQVLEGASRTLNRVDYALLECSFRPLYEGETLFIEMVRLMAGCGFEFSHPLGWLEDPRKEEILQMDALFVKAPGGS